MIDADDDEVIDAKSNLYKQIDGEWVIDKSISHRQMSNNSIYYYSRPTRERLHWQMERMRFSGEPAFYNATAGMKRRADFIGTNPCGEILMQDKGMCNLTTINVFAFVREDKTLDVDGLKEAFRLGARAGYRMATVELELPEWNETQKEDRLLGVSFTGWQDMVNALCMTKEEENELWAILRIIVNETGNMYADSLGMNRPKLATTIKPEGTLSQLPTVSSGIHYSHSPFYIRRVRINSADPLVKVCEELGYPIHPETGQNWDTCLTKVIEFPVKAPNGRTKYDVSAIEQLENYKRTMEYYTDHNTSITVSVRDEEWIGVEQWIWDNWDDVLGISFLPLTDSMYKLMPYEECSEEEYTNRMEKMKPFNPSLITKYELEMYEADELIDDDCTNGACGVK